MATAASANERRWFRMAGLRELSPSRISYRIASERYSQAANYWVTSAANGRATKKRPLPRVGRSRFSLLIFRWERSAVGSTTATTARGFAAAAGFAATARLAATAVTMEQAAQAAEDAAAVGLAARIAAARLATTARLGGATTAGFSGARSSAQRHSWPLRHNHSWLHNRRSLRSSNHCDGGRG